MRGLHQSLLAVQRVFDVAKQFRLDQRRTSEEQSTGTNGRSWRARKMQAARDQLLARAALVEDQHRIIVPADFLNPFVDAMLALGNADDSAASGPRAQRLAQQLTVVVVS